MVVILFFKKKCFENFDFNLLSSQGLLATASFIKPFMFYEIGDMYGIQVHISSIVG